MQAAAAAWRDGATGRIAVMCGGLALAVLVLRVVLFRVGRVAERKLPWLAGRKVQHVLMLAVVLGSWVYNLDSGLLGVMTSAALLAGVVVGWSYRSALHVMVASLLLLCLGAPPFFSRHFVTTLPSEARAWRSSYKGQYIHAVSSPVHSQAIYVYHSHVHLDIDAATAARSAIHRQRTNTTAGHDDCEGNGGCTRTVVSVGARTRLQIRSRSSDVVRTTISLLGSASTLYNSTLHCIAPDHRLSTAPHAGRQQTTCLQLAPDILIEGTQFVFHIMPTCVSGAGLCSTLPSPPPIAMSVTRAVGCNQFALQLSQVWLAGGGTGMPLPVRCAVAPLTAASPTLPLLITHGDLPADVVSGMPWGVWLLRWVHCSSRAVAVAAGRLLHPLVTRVPTLLDGVRRGVAYLVTVSRTVLRYGGRCLLGLLCRACVLPVDWRLHAARLYRHDHAYQLGRRTADSLSRTAVACVLCLRRACAVVGGVWKVVQATVQLLLGPVWCSLRALFVSAARIAYGSVLTHYGSLLCHSAYAGLVWVLSGVGSGLRCAADFLQQLVKRLPPLSLSLLRSSVAVVRWSLCQYYATSFFTHLLLCVLQTCALLVRKQSFYKPHPQRRAHTTASLPRRGAHLLLRTLMPAALPTRLRQYKVIYALWCLGYSGQSDRQNMFRYMRVHFELFTLLVGLSVLPFTTWLYKSTLLVVLPWMSSQAFLAFFVRAFPPLQWQVTALSLIHFFAAILVQHSIGGPFYIILREAATMLGLFVAGCAVMWLWPRSTAQTSCDGSGAAYDNVRDLSERCSSSSSTNVSSCERQGSGCRANGGAAT